MDNNYSDTSYHYTPENVRTITIIDTYRNNISFAISSVEKTYKPVVARYFSKTELL